MSDKQKRLLVVIVGQTASGKSSIAMQTAQQYDGEIISADSWTVYKGFDIGTAKPSRDDRAKVPHHMIDILEPQQDFTAVDFKQQTMVLIDEIHSRDKLPILVGGNGLYIDSVIYNYSFMPPGEPGQRERLNQKSLQELIELADERGISLQGIDTRNSRRIVRAIEADGQRPSKEPMRGNTLMIGIDRDRQELRQRMEDRIEAMFGMGLQFEVKALSDKYGWGIEAMKAIGYREFKSYFDNEISKNELKRQILRSTLRDLAKRQRAWFKKHPQIEWVQSAGEADQLVSDFLKKAE